MQRNLHNVRNMQLDICFISLTKHIYIYTTQQQTDNYSILKLVKEKFTLDKSYAIIVEVSGVSTAY